MSLRRFVQDVRLRNVWVGGLLLLALLLSACQPIVAPVEAQAPAEPGLATGSATIRLSNQFGRALVSARGNHFVIDSAPPLDHPSEEVNPLEAMLASFGTCAIFIVEKAAQDMGIPLDSATLTVQADFDVRGLRGEDFNPKLQAIRAHLDVDGPSAEETQALVEEWTSRCPIYTTYIRATPIEITVNDEAMGVKTNEELATGEIVVSMSNEFGRAIVTARTNAFSVDSVPPLGGPNEGMNPMDLLLAAQGTCGVFIMEKAALEQDIPLESVVGTVEADFDPRGLAGEDFDPRIQQMRVNWELSGVDEAQAETLVDEWLTRCPVYNTLVEATDIVVEHAVVN